MDLIHMLTVLFVAVLFASFAGWIAGAIMDKLAWLIASAAVLMASTMFLALVYLYNGNSPATGYAWLGASLIVTLITTALARRIRLRS